MRFSFKTLAVVGAALVAVAAGTATASAASATEYGVATGHQNTVISQVMAAHPGGVRVSASTVEWNSGAEFVTVPTSSTAPAAGTLCPQNYFCYWDQPGFTGTQNGCAGSNLTGGGWFCSRGFGFNLKPADSYVNATNFRAWLQQNNNHTSPGNELCISAGDANSDLSGDVNSMDRWVWMSTNTAPC